MPTFTMTGARGLEAALAAAGAEVTRQVSRVNETTARLVAARAQGFAPKDRGDLATAIEFDGKGLNWRVGVVDARIAARGGRNSAHLNPAVYGVWYEFGFVTRNIAKHPFMRPAVDREQADYQARLQAVVPAIERVRAAS